MANPTRSPGHGHLVEQTTSPWPTLPPSPDHGPLVQQTEYKPMAMRRGRAGSTRDPWQGAGGRVGRQPPPLRSLDTHAEPRYYGTVRIPGTDLVSGADRN